MNTTSTPLGLPFSLGDSFNTEQVREYFHGGGMWTEVNAAGHGGFAFIVTKMEDDEVSLCEKDRAVYMVMAANVLPDLVKALREIANNDLYKGTSVADIATSALAAAGVQP